MYVELGLGLISLIGGLVGEIWWDIVSLRLFEYFCWLDLSYSIVFLWVFIFLFNILLVYFWNCFGDIFDDNLMKCYIC